MHAIVQDEYGPPDVLAWRKVVTPTPEPGEVLVRVRAAAVNPLDWHFVRGEPYFVRLQSGLRRPKLVVRGADVAGVVVAVGEDVTRVKPGDEVYGEGRGSFAEYVVCEERQVAPKPATLTFEEAAAVPIAATTALQGLRDEGDLRSGQSILVNGASGGVGTFAVQLAKADGAEVTGVCSTRNEELVRSLGADHVVDYTKTDFARASHRYDLVFDLVGNRSLAALRRVLTPEGTLVLSGGTGGRWAGPLGLLARAVVADRFSDQHLRSFLANVNGEDLRVLTDHFEDGSVEPVVDRTYPLRDTPEAVSYLELGHARGKVVLTATIE